MIHSEIASQEKEKSQSEKRKESVKVSPLMFQENTEVTREAWLHVAMTSSKPAKYFRVSPVVGK